MARFIQIGVTAAGLVLLPVFLGGCVSPAQQERAAMLALPYKEFDQTFGSGFRVLYDREEYLKGGVLIEDYLQRHPELKIGEQEFLHLHAGQMFALAKRDDRALKHFDQAMCGEPVPEPGPDWNEMLMATSAFLKQDRAALIATKEHLAATGSTQHVQSVEKFIENLGSSYTEALLWHRLCPAIAIPKDASNANRTAAEKVSKAFGFPIVTVETDTPARCIWVALRPFAPNSPLNGYVVIHTGNGTLITGSSQYWLDEAVDRFIKMVRERNGYREAKFGLATNFDWIK